MTNLENTLRHARALEFALDQLWRERLTALEATARQLGWYETVRKMRCEVEVEIVRQGGEVK